jgi:hypothetical protein
MDGSAGVGVDEVAQECAASTLAVAPENPADRREFMVAACPESPPNEQESRKMAGPLGRAFGSVLGCQLVTGGSSVARTLCAVG